MSVQPLSHEEWTPESENGRAPTVHEAAEHRRLVPICEGKPEQTLPQKAEPYVRLADWCSWRVSWDLDREMGRVNRRHAEARRRSAFARRHGVSGGRERRPVWRNRRRGLGARVLAWSRDRLESRSGGDWTAVGIAVAVLLLAVAVGHGWRRW